VAQAYEEARIMQEGGAKDAAIEAAGHGEAVSVSGAHSTRHDANRSAIQATQALALEALADTKQTTHLQDEPHRMIAFSRAELAVAPCEEGLGHTAEATSSLAEDHAACGALSLRGEVGSTVHQDHGLHPGPLKEAATAALGDKVAAVRKRQDWAASKNRLTQAAQRHKIASHSLVLALDAPPGPAKGDLAEAAKSRALAAHATLAESEAAVAIADAERAEAESTAHRAAVAMYAVEVNLLPDAAEHGRELALVTVEGMESQGVSLAKWAAGKRELASLAEERAGAAGSLALAHGLEEGPHKDVLLQRAEAASATLQANIESAQASVHSVEMDLVQHEEDLAAVRSAPPPSQWGRVLEGGTRQGLDARIRAPKNQQEASPQALTAASESDDARCSSDEGVGNASSLVKHNREEAVRRRLWASVAATFSSDVDHCRGDDLSHRASGLAVGASVIAAGGSIAEASRAAAAMSLHCSDHAHISTLTPEPQQPRQEQQTRGCEDGVGDDEVDVEGLSEVGWGAVMAYQEAEKSRIIQQQQAELSRLRHENARLEQGLLESAGESGSPHGARGGDGRWVPSRPTSNREMAREKAMWRRQGKGASGSRSPSTAVPRDGRPVWETARARRWGPLAHTPEGSSRGVHWSDEDPSAGEVEEGIEHDHFTIEREASRRFEARLARREQGLCELVGLELPEKEYAALQLQRQADQQQQQQQQQQAFAGLDLDGDGVLSRHEFAMAFQHHHRQEEEELRRAPPRSSSSSPPDICRVDSLPRGVLSGDELVLFGRRVYTELSRGRGAMPKEDIVRALDQEQAATSPSSVWRFLEADPRTGEVDAEAWEEFVAMLAVEKGVVHARRFLAAASLGGSSLAPTQIEAEEAERDGARTAGVDMILKLRQMKRLRDRSASPVQAEGGTVGLF